MNYCGFELKQTSQSKQAKKADYKKQDTENQRNKRIENE